MAVRNIYKIYADGEFVETIVCTPLALKKFITDRRKSSIDSGMNKIYTAEYIWTEQAKSYSKAYV